MPVRIIRGAIGSLKSRICMEDIAKLHEENPNIKCIMLVPDHYSFETEKAFVKHFGGMGLNNIEVLTPRKMAIEFLSANNLKYLSDSGRQMLISRAVKEYCEEAKSSLLVRTMKTAGFPHTMERIIAELKKYCVTPETLKSSIETANNEMFCEKIEAICGIYEKYNDFFQEGEYTDSNDDLLRVAQYITDNDSFGENISIWVDRFDDFHPGHMAVFEALIKKNVNITICLNYPKEDINGIYSIMAKTYEKVCSFGNCSEEIFCDEPLGHINSNEIKYLIENYNCIGKHYDDEVTDISLFAARDAYGEIEHVASEILYLVRRENYRYRDIAVMCGNFDDVSHIIKAVFDEYEIPYFSDEKIMLSDHPIAMQILSVFDIFEEDWSYNSVMRYLRSGFIYDAEYNHINQSEIDRLDNYILRYGIRGKKKWEEEKWITEQDSFEKVWGDIPFEETEDEAVNAIKLVSTAPVLNLYKKVRSGKTAYSYAKALFEFMEDLKMYGGLRKDVKAFEESGRSDEAEQFSKIWNLILEVLDQTVVTMGEKQITFSECGEYVKAGLSQCEIKTIPSSVDSVCVGTVERSTAAPIKALFVTGAVNGTYPSDASDEGLLSDADRNFLKEQCEIYLAPDTKASMEQQYFKVYKSLAPVCDKLFVSYPVQNGEGKALGTSVLVQDIKEMFPKLETKDNIIADFGDRSYISAPSATIHKLLINKSKNGAKCDNADWNKAYKWFKENDKYNDKLHLLEKAASFELKGTRLNEENAKDLFGDGDSTYSASRLNVYALCPFSYFMKYGLSAKEQETAKVSANDFGSYAHKFIQEFCIKVEEGAKTPEEKLAKWRQLSDNGRNEYIDEIAEETKTKIREFELHDEARRCNIIDRISKTVKCSAAVVHKSLKKGKYTTSGYEAEFEKVKLCDGVYITGAVDRIDSYTDNNTEYIRIIDYKTGHTGFDILNVCDGVNMQMIIYAVAVKKAEEEVKHNEVKLSGIFYNKVRNDFVKSESEAEANSERERNMRLDGLIFAGENEDGEIDMETLYAYDEDFKTQVEQKLAYKSDFSPLGRYKNGKITGIHTETEGKALMKYVTDKICYIDKNIKSGRIEVSPYEESSSANACTWCEYKESCAFEREDTQMRKPRGTKDEAWARLVKEYKEDTDNG